jgi:hypothetical protein
LLRVAQCMELWLRCTRDNQMCFSECRFLITVVIYNVSAMLGSYTRCVITCVLSISVQCSCRNPLQYALHGRCQSLQPSEIRHPTFQQSSSYYPNSPLETTQTDIRARDTAGNLQRIFCAFQLATLSIHPMCMNPPNRKTATHQQAVFTFFITSVKR